MITRKIIVLILALVFVVMGVFFAAHNAEAENALPQTTAQARGLVFNHALHAQQGLECDACHSAAAASTTGKDDLLPRHPQCADCHDVQAADNCKMCHTAAEPKLSARVTAYNRKFDHKRHIENGKLECAVCHANLDAPLAEGKTVNVPAMGECMDCHTTKRVKNECMTCHLPTDDLKPADHKLDWTNLHGAAAATNNSCVQCHKTDDCQKCHNGDPVFNPHPRDYRARHGQDAHLSDISCSVCHEERSFCNSCHRDMHVLPTDHLRPNWANAEGGEHSTQAAFDLESCMSCHDTPGIEPVCVQCHGK